jgi:hypothetical protein
VQKMWPALKHLLNNGKKAPARKKKSAPKK